LDCIRVPPLESQWQKKDKQPFPQSPNQCGDGNNCQVTLNAGWPFCVNPIHEPSFSTVFH